MIRIRVDAPPLKNPSASARALAIFSVSVGRRLMTEKIHGLDAGIEVSRLMWMFDTLMTGGIGTSRLTGLKHAPRVCLVADRSTMDVLVLAACRLGQLAGQEPETTVSKNLMPLTPLSLLARLNFRMSDTVADRPRLTVGVPRSSIRRVTNRIERVHWAMICGLTSTSPRTMRPADLQRVLGVLSPISHDTLVAPKRRARKDLQQVSDWMEQVELHAETIPPEMQSAWSACRSYWDKLALAAVQLAPAVRPSSPSPTRSRRL